MFFLERSEAMNILGADLGGGCKRCDPLPRDNLRLSKATGITEIKTLWFIGAEVKLETRLKNLC